MLSNRHLDGGAFRLTVTYRDAQAGAEREYVMFGDSDDELIAHYLAVRHIWDMVSKITIEDEGQ